MIASIPAEILREIEGRTGSIISGFSFSSGGCINHGGKVTTTSGAVYFLKWNDLKKFPGMFAAEASGLSLLRNANCLTVPEVILEGQAGAYQFLLLNYIEEAPRADKYWEHFGRGLALLHKQSASAAGLDHDNYIGSLPQRNTRSSSGVEFLIHQRLQVQLRLAHDQNKIEIGASKRFESLFSKLPSLLPEEPPALLHGDLWSGNLMTDANGQPCLIDPAVYYGNREADLAMTQLFGGFDRSFFESYGHEFPLIPGYEERFEIYNLYPLLVHLNLFGEGYQSQVVSILKKFV